MFVTALLSEINPAERHALVVNAGHRRSSGSGPTARPRSPCRLPAAGIIGDPPWAAGGIDWSRAARCSPTPTGWSRAGRPRLDGADRQRADPRASSRRCTPTGRSAHAADLAGRVRRVPGRRVARRRRRRGAGLDPQRRVGWAVPSRWASSVRERTRAWRRCGRWPSTVLGETNSRAATSLVCSPSATSSATRCSVGVRAPEAGGRPPTPASSARARSVHHARADRVEAGRGGFQRRAGAASPRAAQRGA